MPPTAHTHDDDQERLDQRRQRVDRRLDLLVVEVGDLVEHLVERAGLLTDRHHLHDHRREHLVLARAAWRAARPRLTAPCASSHGARRRPRCPTSPARCRATRGSAHPSAPAPRACARTGPAPSCGPAGRRPGTRSLMRVPARARPASVSIHRRKPKHRADRRRRRRCTKNFRNDVGDRDQDPRRQRQRRRRGRRRSPRTSGRRTAASRSTISSDQDRARRPGRSSPT